MRRKSTKWLIPGLIFFPILFVLWGTHKSPNNPFPTNKSYQWNPFSWPRRVENFDFYDTSSEQQCQNGTILRINAQDAPPTIPRIVHLMWGLKGDGRFTFANYLSIKTILHSVQPDQIQLHYSRLDRENSWFRAVEQNLTLVHHDMKAIQNINPHWHVAHMSDVLRLQVLLSTGGIYFDSDVYALQSFDTILQGARDAVLGHEGGNRYGLCNAIIVAKPKSRFVARWLEEYESFSEQDWNYHSVVLPKKLANQYPDDLCALSPTAFFWPLWTESHVEYMHEELTMEEAGRVEAEVENNGGGLYGNQLAYHAWSHNSFERFVERLTPEIIREENTRFNILMRRFLN